MAAEANWSELPKDLLNLISQRIDTEIDLIRFRSACVNWRSSSITPNHDPNILPFKFPNIFPFDIESVNNDTIRIPLCHLSEHNFYLIKPPQQQQEQQTLINRPWLVRVTQNSCGKTRLSQPEFHASKSYDFPFDMLDFSKLSVQLAATCYFLFPYFLVVSAYLICSFKGRIYVLVDEDGKTFTVGPEDNPKVQLAAEPLVGFGNKKFLLESNGELLLVDVNYDDGFVIHMFRLDEIEKKWVKFNHLLDRVLFLGLKYSFSASALDLCVPKGNCIIFIDNFFFNDVDTMHGMSIVHLEDEDSDPSPLIDHPEYYNLLWPPPEWIVKSQIR